MKIEANSVEEYMENIAENHKLSVDKLREIVKLNIPKGFEETMSYGMIGYVIPHDLYPNGYHCNPKLPLPFINIASQKNFIAFYHMGIYAMPDLYSWFIDEYTKLSQKKIDMGKSCIRFKKPEDIPLGLIGELVKKVSVENWIETYESAFVSNRKK
jgi:uncharacterized protein YdhG (YjbR/CyaY superfamily)